MKNSPEPPFNDEFEKRIASYSEMPDDVVWKNIDNALRPNRMLVLMAWWDSVTSLVIVSLLLGTTFMTPPHNTLFEANSHSVIADSVKISAEKSGTYIEEAEVPDRTSEDFVIRNSTLTTKDEIPDLASKKTVIVGKTDFSNYVSKDSSQTQPMSVSLVKSSVQTESLTGESTVDSLLTSEIAKETANEKIVEEKSSGRSLKNLKIYLSATPMLNFHQVVPVAGDGIGVTGFENPSILSADRLNISLSAGLQGYISRSVEYYGGVIYFHRKTSMRYSFISEETLTEFGNGMGYSITPEINVSEFEYSTKNVGVQGGILFRLYGKKLVHKVGAGLLYYKGFADSSKEEIYNNNTSSHFSYQVFYRNEIPINRRLKLFVQPTFTNSFYVDENLKDRPFKLKPYSAGIGFGAIFQLD